MNIAIVYILKKTYGHVKTDYVNFNPEACLCTHTPVTSSHCDYDVDENGTIGLGDLNHVLENWDDFDNGFSDYLLLIL